ncbi:hypothetical protein NDU88_002123 [Pleurodeles waltl]|uniref:Uncharacterized protein n=1 Tax=Pleurodeles waltl TaxID=8319 RepID=A0AAV7NH42_PLEWA|nr:hypothetical protein NDU88_002123 [Pleurodeles waltl]
MDSASHAHALPFHYVDSLSMVSAAATTGADACGPRGPRRDDRGHRDQSGCVRLHGGGPEGRRGIGRAPAEPDAGAGRTNTGQLRPDWRYEEGLASSRYAACRVAADRLRQQPLPQ